LRLTGETMFRVDRHFRQQVNRPRFHCNQRSVKHSKNPTDSCTLGDLI
jgi:hypothetical protein